MSHSRRSSPDPATGTPTGTVTFTIDGQAETPSALAVVSGVDQATFSTGTLTVGPHTITAAYSGDTAFATSTSAPLTQTVNPVPLATTTSLSAATNPSTFGENATFTAVVAPTAQTASTPTGTVTFTIDGQLEPPVDLAVVNGADEAVFSTATLTVGPHTISAAYERRQHVRLERGPTPDADGQRTDDNDAPHVNKSLSSGPVRDVHRDGGWPWRARVRRRDR